MSKRRKGRSDKATQGGVGPGMARRGGRDREKKKGGTKDGSVDGKMLPGARQMKGGGSEGGSERKQKQEAVYVSLDGRATPTLCHVSAHFPAHGEQ